MVNECEKYKRYTRFSVLNTILSSICNDENAPKGVDSFAYITSTV